MPGPSFAPIFAAVGAFLLFLGVVFGGLTLLLGAIALAIGLLYWLRESTALYERDVERTRRSCRRSPTTARPRACTCLARRSVH